MVKTEINDSLDGDENCVDFDGPDSEDQAGKADNSIEKYEIRRRIEELQEQKRLDKMLNDFDDYLEA
ncbi:MAG: hypothetical protein PVH46_06970 [Granulosicoccaceae bacterium]